MNGKRWKVVGASGLSKQAGLSEVKHYMLANKSCLKLITFVHNVLAGAHKGVWRGEVKPHRPSPSRVITII